MGCTRTLFLHTLVVGAPPSFLSLALLGFMEGPSYVLPKDLAHFSDVDLTNRRMSCPVE